MSSTLPPYVPSPAPSGGAISQWFTKGVTPWIAAELQKIADSMPRRARTELRKFQLKGHATFDMASAAHMFATVDSNTAIELPYGLNLSVEDTLEMRDRENVVFDNPGQSAPTRPNDGCPVVTYRGPPGKDVLSFPICRNLALAGFRIDYDAVDDFRPNRPVARRGIVFDEYGPDIGSASVVARVKFATSSVIEGMDGVAISPTAQQNHEFYAIKHCAFRLNPHPFHRVLLAIDKDSDVATVVDPSGAPVPFFLGAGWELADVRVAWRNPDGAIETFTTAIVAVVGGFPSAQCQLVSPAPFSAKVAHAVLGSATAAGVHVGPSANAKAIYLEDNDGATLAHLLWMENGSALCVNNKGGSNVADYRFDNAADECWIAGSTFEGSLQFLRWNGAQPLTIGPNKADRTFMMPGTGWFEFGPNTDTVLRFGGTYAGSAPGDIPEGAVLDDLARANEADLTSVANTMGGLALAQMGWVTPIDANAPRRFGETYASIVARDRDVVGNRKRLLLINTALEVSVNPLVPGDPTAAIVARMQNAGVAGPAGVEALRLEVSALPGTGAGQPLRGMVTRFGVAEGAIRPAGLTMTPAEEEGLEGGA